jgi:hypothetical protein
VHCNPSQSTRGVQNPYTTSRKRSVESTPDIQQLNSMDHRRHDLASIVLGRPTPPQNVPVSRKQHRRRAYRDRWEFGCSLEIGTKTDSYESVETQEIRTPTSSITGCFDGDVAGGAAIQNLASSNDQVRLSTPPQTFDQMYGNFNDTEKVYAPDEDDDLLSFVAFPATHGRLTS